MLDGAIRRVVACAPAGSTVLTLDLTGEAPIDRLIETAREAGWRVWATTAVQEGHEWLTRVPVERESGTRGRKTMDVVTVSPLHSIAVRLAAPHGQLPRAWAVWLWRDVTRKVKGQNVTAPGWSYEVGWLASKDGFTKLGITMFSKLVRDTLAQTELMIREDGSA